MPNQRPSIAITLPGRQPQPPAVKTVTAPKACREGLRSGSVRSRRPILLALEEIWQPKAKGGGAQSTKNFFTAYPQLQHL